MVPHLEAQGLGRMRDFAAHGNYSSIDLTLFWYNIRHKPAQALGDGRPIAIENDGVTPPKHTAAPERGESGRVLLLRSPTFQDPPGSP